MNRVLVTGAAGGIGTRLRTLLKGIYPDIRWSDLNTPAGLKPDERFIQADLAVMNEVVWRNFSDDFWVAFKVWGTMPITIIFTLAQMPLIMKHSVSPAAGSEP